MKIKYLAFSLFLVLFIGCEQHKNNNNKEINHTIPKNKGNIQKETQNEIIIKGKDFNLTFKNKKLIYPKKRIILLFYKNDLYSIEEEKTLKKLHLNFHKTNNKTLEKIFHIKYYPTIVILDHNKTIKYENFTPYEILKAEGL